jgi:hypothetical protein
MSCTPAMKRLELRYGLLTSVAVAGSMGAIVLTTSPAPDMYALVSFVFSIVSYLLDIVLAKRCFESWSGDGRVQVIGIKAGEFRDRLAWCGRSLLSMSFLRFLALALLDSLVINMLTKFATAKLDKLKVAVEHKRWRDPVVLFLIGAITFNLYVNVMRFTWVYTPTPSPMVTLIICMWLAFTVVQASDV